LVEDALKLTRTLHRLIIAVSGISIVFAFSVSLPEEKIRQRDAIEALLSTDFTSYREFIDARVASFAEAQLQPIAEEVERTFAEGEGMVINDFELVDRFRQPIHVGRVLVEELVLAAISAATLNQLDALNGLDLDRDVQVVLPRADIAVEIAQFFESEKGARRISGIGIALDVPDWTAQSFLPKTDDAIAVINFELPATVNIGATPIFQAQFECDVVELENTSFLTWLKTRSEMAAIVTIENNQIRFDSELTGLSSGVREDSLGNIASSLALEIAQLGPDQQTATFLGTSVPGRLVLFAAPIVLIALQYYFAHHTRHLVRLAPKNISAFRQFAWLPLSLERDISQTWRTETGATVIAGPLFALGFLLYRLNVFGDTPLLAVLLSAGAGLATMLLGMSSLNNIGEIRDQMQLDM